MLRSAADVPAALVDELMAAMAQLMKGTEEAKRCEGLSFSFRLDDVAVRAARYTIGARGSVRLARDDGAATFSFHGPADGFDSVLLGRQSALSSILSRRIHMHGSLLHLRQILRMMPAVHRAYAQARADVQARHADRYEFRF